MRFRKAGAEVFVKPGNRGEGFRKVGPEVSEGKFPRSQVSAFEDAANTKKRLDISTYRKYPSKGFWEVGGEVFGQKVFGKSV